MLIGELIEREREGREGERERERERLTFISDMVIMMARESVILFTIVMFA